jgi:hypothetical protein
MQSEHRKLKQTGRNRLKDLKQRKNNGYLTDSNYKTIWISCSGRYGYGWIRLVCVDL